MIKPIRLPERTPWLIVALIGVPVFIGALDLTIISAVLPAVVLDLEVPLQTGLDDAAWAVSGYLLAYTISMTFMGRVSDLIGRRRVYLICLVIFMLGSWFVAVADYGPTDLVIRVARRWFAARPDRSGVALALLIAGRAVQALGAGAMVPVSMALVGDIFPPGRRAQPLGVIGAVDTAGWVIGHLYGGLMVQIVSWRVLFWLNIPICLLALGLIAWALGAVRESRPGVRFDFAGALAITLSLVALNVGLGANTEVPVGTPVSFEELAALPDYAVPMLIVSAVLLGLFVLVEGRTDHPLLNLALLRDRNFSSASFANLFVGFCLMIGLVSVPILVNGLRAETIEQGALETGLLLSALTLPMAAAAVPGGWLSSRFGFRVPAVLGLGIASVGFALVGVTWRVDVPYYLVAVEMVLIGVGLGMTISPLGTAVINAAGEHERGSASSLVIILRLIGMTVSMSSLTTFALRRSTAIMAARSGSQVFDVNQARLLFYDVTAQVLREIGWLGMIMALVGLGIALFLRGGESAAGRGLTDEGPTPIDAG